MMGMQNVTGISPVQVISAYGGTQSDVSSMEKQRDRLMMELEKVNAAPGGAATVNRREQLQRQIRLIEVQLAQKSAARHQLKVSPHPRRTQAHSDARNGREPSGESA